jgi:L-alanine-DL-glutamate epimerase-like enolase superfamily enzyme
MVRIRKILFRHIRRPLKTTFATALGRKDEIHSIIVRAILEDGKAGEGEIPTSFAFREESIPAITGVLQRIIPGIRGTCIADYPSLIRELRLRYPSFTMTLSGLEVALFRASLGSNGLEEFTFWGGRERSCRTDITVPFTNDLERTQRWVKRAAGIGFTEFKVKTSGNREADIAYLDWIYRILKPNGDFRIRLDGNQGYRKDVFLKFMDDCRSRNLPIEMVEQPLPKDDYEGHRQIRKNLAIPIILDESVRSMEDFKRVSKEECCDGVNIKIAKSGITESKQIMEAARACGMKLMIGCMTETMLGLSTAIYLAAGAGGFDYIDLDSVYFLFHSAGYRNIEMKGPEIRIL